MVSAGVVGSPAGRVYDIHVEERRRLWFDHYVTLGQFTAAQRIAEAGEVPEHAPPSLRPAGEPGGSAVHESVRVAGLQLPAFNPHKAATIIQRSVRGEQARSAALWLREEQKHRAWLQYCVATEQFDRAAGLGLYHELAAMRIQRAVRAWLVAHTGYELSCPVCAALFVLRKVPRPGLVECRCPECAASFQLKVVEPAWWTSPVLLEPEDPEVLKRLEYEARLDSADARLGPFQLREALSQETARAQWIRYYLECGDVESARKLGLDHERAARTLQRRWRAFWARRVEAAAAEAASEVAERTRIEAEAAAQEAARLYAEAAAEAARLQAEAERAQAEAERVEAEQAAHVLQSASRRQRYRAMRKRRRLAEIAARIGRRNTDERVQRFLRKLNERVYERAKMEHQASLVLVRAIRHFASARVRSRERALRAALRAIRMRVAARVIQHWYALHKAAELAIYAHGYLGKHSRKGSWQTRYFYLHEGFLCYLPSSAFPQPQPAAQLRKALLKWEQNGTPPKKLLKLADVRNIVGNAQTRTLELTLADGQLRSYKTVSEHDLILWKRSIEKYPRFRRVAQAAARGGTAPAAARAA